MNEQPTNDELAQAWTAAIDADIVGGARADSLQNLRRLRDLRTTWFGEKEMLLRRVIDNYLSGGQP